MRAEVHPGIPRWAALPAIDPEDLKPDHGTAQDVGQERDVERQLGQGIVGLGELDLHGQRR
jgi:hypothetical protein